jgi:hypothetical protein
LQSRHLAFHALCVRRAAIGILEPVRGGHDAGLYLGLGKLEEDSFYTAAENFQQRKRLNIEVQAEEDEDSAQRRLLAVAEEERRKADVREAERRLYCDVSQ